jgi:hypothetical protein
MLEGATLISEAPTMFPVKQRCKVSTEEYTYKVSLTVPRDVSYKDTGTIPVSPGAIAKLTVPAVKAEPPVLAELMNSVSQPTL